MNKTLCMGLLLCVTAVFAAGDDEIRNLFDEIFADKIKKARATPSKADDAEVAAELLAATSDLGEEKKVLILCCEKAYEMGSAGPGGYATAIKAMRLLAREAGDRKREALSNIVKVRKRMYSTSRNREQRTRTGNDLIEDYMALAEAQESASDPSGALNSCRLAMTIARSIRSDRADELKAEYNRMAAMRATYDRIKTLKTTLKSRPDDAKTAEKLVKTILVELDNPAEASGYITPVKDEKLKTNVPLAAKDIAEIRIDQAVELGNWYKSLADESPAAFKANMLTRAAAYLEKALAGTEDKGLAQLKIKVTLEKINQELTRAPGGKTGTWLDLMKATKLEDCLLAGKSSDFGRQGTGLRISNGYGGGTPCLALPAVPTGSYELQATASFAKKGAFLFLLPVGSTSVGLALNSNGRVSLASVDGAEWPPKEVRFPMVEGKVEVTIRVMTKGRDAAIRISPADITKAISWSGSAAALTPKGWEKAKLKSIGISVDGYPTVIVSDLKIRSLSGRIQPLSPEDLQQSKAGMKAK